MRITIEATAACRPNRTGIARYTVSLVDAHLRAGADVQLAYRLSRLKRWKHAYKPAGARLVWVQEPWLPLRKRCDVVHGTDARVPGWRGVARVATVHDVFSLLFTEFAPEGFREKKRAAYAKLAAECDRIIAVSASTKRDFLRFVDFPAERIDVVHEGVDEAFRPRRAEEVAAARGRFGLPARYLLYVGELSARKNIPGLLKGFAAAGLDEDVHLALTGAVSFQGQEALAPIAELGLGERVHLLGYVETEDLPALYSGAAAFVFPTFYEGFGLPVLEAMASGTPVVAGERGAAAEIAGGHAALVDPEDPEAIGAAIAEALARTPAELETARAHAAAFTWDACAEKTRAVYRRAVEER